MFTPNLGKRPKFDRYFSQTGWNYVTSDLLDGFNNITLSIMVRSDLRSRFFQMTFELPKVRSLNLWKRSLETPQFENLQTAEPGVSSWCDFYPTYFCDVRFFSLPPEAPFPKRRACMMGKSAGGPCIWGFTRCLRDLGIWLRERWPVWSWNEPQTKMVDHRRCL